MLADQIGQAAEFLVCYDFAKRGFKVSHCPFEQHSFDLLVDTGDLFLRVQVKGTEKPGKGGPKEKAARYRFNINRTPTERAGRVDIYALVALDIETVHYSSVENIKERGNTIWVPRSGFVNNFNQLILDEASNIRQLRVPMALEAA